MHNSQLVRYFARLAVSLWLGLATVHAQAQSTPAVKLVIGIEDEAGTVVGRWGRLLYAEISRRMGVPIEVQTFPMQRRSELADAGLIDGETSRIYSYAEAHPNLIRVEEFFANLRFALYTATPDLRIQRLGDLSAGNLLVDYRRGILMCEKALKPLLPDDRLSTVTDGLQGIRKLIAGRSDVYCDLELSARTALNDPSLKGAAAVRKLFDLGNIPTYPYLHKKHAALAPRMAAVIKQMNAEGLVEAYQRQAEREFGWQR